MAGLPTKDSTASFWHSEPSTLLLDHRTTPELPSYADVVIVGSGITGASAARFLAEDERAKGASIVMLEARQACWGATGRNGGHCQPLLFDSTPDVAQFELTNWHTVKSYIEEHNIQCEWQSRPSCRTFWSEELAEEAKKAVQNLKNVAPELGRLVNVIEGEEHLKNYLVNAHEEYGAVAATVTSTAASLWPYKLIAFILEKLVTEGRLNLQTMTPVEKIDIPIDSKGRHCLHTPRGSISTKHVILATNAYTSHLLPEFEELIVPDRAVMSALLPPLGARSLSNSYGFVGAKGNSPKFHDYLIQRPSSGVPNPGGHLMFGGGWVAAGLDSIGETDDSVLDEDSAEYLREQLLYLLELGGASNVMDELEATHQWCGIIGRSKDQHPWIGAVPDRTGVWLAGGYSGHGMPNGTLCGKAVVEMLLGEESGAPIEYVEEKLVRTGNLPQAYVITKDRMERCKALDPVSVQFGESQAKAVQETLATNPQALRQRDNHALQDYQMQLMLLEQQRKKQAKAMQEELATDPQSLRQRDNDALQDYQMQLMLLEQQRKKQAKAMQEELATDPQSLRQRDNHALQDYQMQLMLLEQQRKKQAKAVQEELATDPQSLRQRDNHALQDYQMQLMLFEQQRKKRLLMERMCDLDESDSKHQGESTSEQGRNIALPHRGGHPAP